MRAHLARRLAVADGWTSGPHPWCSGRVRGAGDGVLGLPEQLGGLARAASEHVPQHEMAKRYGCSNRSDDATATRPHLAAASASVDDSLE